MITKEIIQKVSIGLGIPATGHEQDWAIEFADKKRVKDFVNALAGSSRLERQAIMSLILASYDELLQANDVDSQNLWIEIARHLNEDRANYNELLNYWALWSESDVNEWFDITPLIRELVS